MGGRGQVQASPQQRPQVRPGLEEPLPRPKVTATSVQGGGEVQVWSLTQFYSVDYSHSRISVEKVRFQQTLNQGLHQLFVTASWDLCA